MQNISEDEARALIRRPLFCEDIDAWTPLKIQPDTTACGGGVLNEHGESVRMYVELTYRHSHRTKVTKYVFTLFKRSAHGKERIYQLDVAQTPKRVTDRHKLSHEHIGSRRQDGNADWAAWSYDEVLAHFCTSTNLTFIPVSPHPEDFQLKGNK